MKEYLPGDKNQHDRIAEILRVNHAGEYGANYIYKGQLSVLTGNAKIENMLKQEQEHLEFFKEELIKHRFRPSILSPLWSFGGYILGKLTAKMGEEAAMMCTEAVESAIVEHYDKQIDEIKDLKPQLALKIEQFRNDELEHHDEAIKAGSKNSPAYSILYNLIKQTSKVAIKIAEKI